MMIKKLIALCLSVTLVGCAGLVHEQIRAVASSTLDCSGANLSVQEHAVPNSIAVGWTVHGCRREAECAWTGSSGASERLSNLVTNSPDRHMVCEETGSSQARIAESAIKDRLSMETGCDEAQIKVVKRGAWQKAGQSSWRMEACGQPYVCSSGRTGMDCKPALALGAQEPRAPAAPAAPEAAGMGRCTASEVAEMKNGGMSAPAIERACSP